MYVIWYNLLLYDMTCVTGIVIIRKENIMLRYLRYTLD